MRDEYDDEDEPRRPRRRRPETDDEDWEADDYDERRPRRRRRPPPADGLGLVIPVNTSVLAIIAGYLGLISVLLVPAPFALLLGILALVQLGKNPDLRGRGRAWFAVVMGTICSIPLLFIAAAVIAKK